MTIYTFPKTEKEPKMKFFDFGAFQKIMKMLSREKTSFKCFLGHLMVPPRIYLYANAVGNVRLFRV